MTEETGDTGGTGETVDPFLDQGDQGRKFSVGKAGWKILVKNFWLKYLDRQCEDMAKNSDRIRNSNNLHNSLRRRRHWRKKRQGTRLRN